MSINDLRPSNFTTYLSCNKAAFLKFFATMLRGDEEGRFRITPAAASLMLKDSLRAARVHDLLRARKSRSKMSSDVRDHRLKMALGGLLDSNVLFSGRVARWGPTRRLSRPVDPLRDPFWREQVVALWSEIVKSNPARELVSPGMGDRFAEAIKIFMAAAARENLVAAANGVLPGVKPAASPSYSSLPPAYRAGLSKRVGGVDPLGSAFLEHMALRIKMLKLFFFTPAAIRSFASSVYFNRRYAGVSSVFNSIFSKNYLLKSRIDRKFKLSYSAYVYNSVYRRRAREYLVSASKNLLYKYTREGTAAALRSIPVHRRRKFLFKINPDIRGRSRVFYYVQKKT